MANKYGKKLVINDIEYDSYYSMCGAFGVDFKEFMNYKRTHKDISEMDLLWEFLGKPGYTIGYRIDTGAYKLRKKLESEK